MIVERPFEWWAKRAEDADDGDISAGAPERRPNLWDRLAHGVEFLKASSPDPAAVEAMSPAALFGAMVDRVVAMRQELCETELRRMLGCWVSELEPTFVLRDDGRLAGLTIEGARNPDGTAFLYVLSQYVDPADPYGVREPVRCLGALPYMPGDKVELDLRP